MIHIDYLKNFAKDQREAIHVMSDLCMANEEYLNTGEMCQFISDRFYQRFKNLLFIVDLTKKDGIRGSAMLYEVKNKMMCISYLFVKRVFRHKGIATRIFKTAIKYAKSIKMKVCLNVNARNNEAIALYTKLKFVPDRRQDIRMVLE